MVTRFATSPPTDNSPQPKEAQPLSQLDSESLLSWQAAIDCGTSVVSDTEAGGENVQPRRVAREREIASRATEPTTAELPRCPPSKHFFFPLSDAKGGGGRSPFLALGRVQVPHVLRHLADGEEEAQANLPPVPPRQISSLSVSRHAFVRGNAPAKLIVRQLSERIAVAKPGSHPAPHSLMTALECFQKSGEWRVGRGQ
jgi:hypothetical protein